MQCFDTFNEWNDILIGNPVGQRYIALFVFMIFVFVQGLGLRNKDFRFSLFVYVSMIEFGLGGFPHFPHIDGKE